MPDRNRVPELGKPNILELKNPEHVVLNNGLDVYVLNSGEEAVTRFDLVLPAGSAHQEKKLVASTVSDLLREGTQRYSSTQIADKIDFHGAYFDVSSSKDTTVLMLFCLTKHLPSLLPIIANMLNKALFPEDELRIHLDRKRQEYLVNIEKVRYKASLEFNKLVFGKGSAYGQILETEDFDKLKKEDLLHFYHSHYGTANSYIILSGMVNDTVVKLVSDEFGGELNAGIRKSENRINYSTKSADRLYLVRRKDSMQSAIRIGRQIVNKLHPDYNRILLLNTVLGGYFGSRLMSNLREDKAYTYGVNSFVTNFIHGGYFSVATEVNVEYTSAALKEIYHEIKLLREQKISDEELQLVKNYIYGAFLRNFDGPFHMAEKFRAVHDYGLDFDFYVRSLDEILKIDANQLIETANKYLQTEDLYQLVVGEIV